MTGRVLGGCKQAGLPAMNLRTWSEPCLRTQKIGVVHWRSCRSALVLVVQSDEHGHADHSLRNLALSLMAPEYCSRAAKLMEAGQNILECDMDRASLEMGKSN